MLFPRREREEWGVDVSRSIRNAISVFVLRRWPGPTNHLGNWCGACLTICMCIYIYIYNIYMPAAPDFSYTFLPLVTNMP